MGYFVKGRVVLGIFVMSFAAQLLGCSPGSPPAPTGTTAGLSPAAASQVQTVNMSLANGPYALTSADIQTLQSQNLLQPGDQTALSNFVNTGN